MASLRVISEDFFNQVFEYDFEGQPVRISRNKITGEISISADDCARILGFDNLNDLLSTDKGLDAISNWKRDNPGKPVFGECGSNAMFQKTAWE